MSILNTKKQLLQEISLLEPYNANEKKHIEATVNFINLHKNPFFRSLNEGHLTVGVFLLSPDLTKVLMTKHKVIKKWLNLGGHVEAIDSCMLDAALREAREESGIDDIVALSENVVDIDVHTIKANDKKQEPTHLHYDFRYFLKAEHENFVVSDESDSLTWLSLDDIMKDADLPDNMARMVAKWQSLLLENSCS